MRIVDKDGNVIEGTFMEAAKGYDFKNLPPEAARITPAAIQNTDGKAFRDLANLQVLDYICGNFDRHYVNMFYQFDENGKLCGVQGIDNDGAFGAIGKKQLQDEGYNYSHLVNLSNMKVIPKETAARVMALDEAALKYMLRGYGLSEEELQAAGFRLNKMKQAITRSKQAARGKKIPGIRLLSSSDFKKTSIDKLRTGTGVDDPEESTNLFSIADDVVHNLGKQVEKQTKEYQALEATAALGMGNRAERIAAGQERIKAALNYLQKKLPDFNENLLDEHVRYPQGASDYTKRRIDVAIDALKLARQSSEIKEVELQTARDNERQAAADRQRHSQERNPDLIQNQVQPELQIRTN